MKHAPPEAPSAAPAPAAQARAPSRQAAAGAAAPLGAHFEGDGVNFAVLSAEAEKIELCLFSPDGARETDRIAFPDRDGDAWRLRVPGLRPGQLYGLRAHGPYAPEEGRRFNPNKLLVDPAARRIATGLCWGDELMGYAIGAPRGDLSFDTRDSAPFAPKCMVVDPAFSWGDDRPPDTPWHETVIYEAHVKNLTALHPDVPEEERGRYAGLASPAMIEHLTALGVTAVELMPVHAFIDDRFLVEKGLGNHWGYQSIGWFAPEERYALSDPVAEFQFMVARLHAAGIEVILDVVYNHTAENDEYGPTLSFRGLDNRSYYRLREGGRRHVNDTGTGNTLNLSSPLALRTVMDSLRYWVEVMHVDGFRFDLATVLARGDHGFDAGGGFLAALRQDPVLSRVKLIAEPWDLGPGGYRLGAWPHPFREWNDRFRDTARRFWRGDALMAADLSKRLLGSADVFDHGRRDATASVNFVTAHDGFTLEDLVSYTAKRNEANGEGNRDGAAENFSDNLGREGPTDDPVIRAARDRRKRNLLATLMLSQGAPMLLSGDEIGRSQGGNNNSYAQDNSTSWLDWESADENLLRFVRRLIAMRRDHPVLRQRHFLHSRERKIDGLPDLVWRRADGAAPRPADWNDPGLRTLCVKMRHAAPTDEPPLSDDMVFAVLNAGPEIDVALPEVVGAWRLILDTTRPDAPPEPARGSWRAPAASVLVFARSES